MNNLPRTLFETHQTQAWVESLDRDYPQLASLDSTFVSLLQQMRRNVNSTILRDCFFTTLTESIHSAASDAAVEALLRMCKDPIWQGIFEEKLDKNFTLVETLIDQAYQQSLRQSYPRLWDELLEVETQRILVERNDINFSKLKYKAILAQYGHSYLKERKSVGILRITEPANKGSSRKGKEAEVPQEDMICLIYNFDVLGNSNSGKALVSFDGKSFEFIDTGHTRVRVISRDSMVAESMSKGFYEFRDSILAVRGIIPFWRTVLSDIIKQVHTNHPTLRNESYTRLQAKVRGVSTIEREPADFLKSLKLHSGWGAFLESEDFKQSLIDHSSQVAIQTFPAKVKALKLLTLI